MTLHAARDIAAQVQGRTRSAVAGAQEALGRAAALNPQLDALTCLNTDLLAVARAVDARVVAGEHLPLAGVPVVIKDNIRVKGLPVTNGSRLFADFIAPEDAIAVSRLRAAGAMILGIGTCSEFACKGGTNTPLHGITRHPANPDLAPGGSSGGSAVAVAAGIAPVATATDAGGSERRPAADVGVVGFKPGQDAVPCGPGFPEPVWGISVVGPITRDVRDAALVCGVPGGTRDETNRATKPRCAHAPDMDLGGAIDHDVAVACDAAIAALSGTTGIERSAPLWEAACRPSPAMPRQRSGPALPYGERWLAAPELFDPDIGAQIGNGLAMTGVEATPSLHAMRATLQSFLSDHDVLITPTTPCPALSVTDIGPAMIGGKAAHPRDHAAFTPQANHAGLPAISIPCGFAAQDLPVGLQLIGRAGSDHALLAMAHRFETTLDPAGLTRTGTKALQ